MSKLKKYLTVENHTLELPDGNIISEWPWVITPDFVNVLAVTEKDEFLCFRQTKYSVDGVSLAVAGGYLEPSEDPLEGAKRELLEETGYESTDWISLGQYSVDGNRGAGRAHLYLARDAHWVSEVNTDDLEEQKLLLLSRPEIERALAASEFKVLPWATVVALGLRYMS